MCANETSNQTQMGSPNITITWKIITKLVIVLILVNILNIIFALGLLFTGFEILDSVGYYINMVSNGNDGTILTFLLVLSVVISTPFNIIGILLLFRSLNRKENQFTNKLLFFCVLAMVIVVIAILCIGIGSVVHSYKLHDAIKDGIMEAMQKYGVDSEMKIKIDHLQVEFQCCGSQHFKEWFAIEWFDQNLGGKKAQPGKTYVSDDAPFSCCLIASRFPCIHHGITTIGVQYNYDPARNLSISSTGCHTAIMDKAKGIGWKIFLLLFGFSILQLITCLGMRLVQTSHSEFFFFKRHDHEHTAWLIGSMYWTENAEKLRAPTPPPFDDNLSE